MLGFVSMTSGHVTSKCHCCTTTVIFDSGVSLTNTRCDSEASIMHKVHHKEESQQEEEHQDGNSHVLLDHKSSLSAHDSG